MEFKNFSLLELEDFVKTGTATYEEIYAYFLDRAKKYNEELHVFNTLPIEGKSTWLPIAVKDIFCETWVRTTAASKMLGDFVPPYESTVTERMKQAGYVSFGKTNMDEFAMGSSGENSALGPTKNPWDPARVPGWSSSGSAVTVASGLAPAALGTDTGGSIRQPASMVGVVGFKPSYGRNSRYGIMPMASSLDCPGYFTHTVRDAGHLYEVTAWHDPHDATSLINPVTLDPKIWERKDLTWVRVGVPKEYFIEGIEEWVEKTIRAAIEKLRSLGAEIVDISLPHTSQGISVYYIICPAEVASNMARYDGIRYGHIAEWAHDISRNRSEGIGEEVQRRSLVGSYVLSSGFYDAYYKRASDVRELIREDFRNAFSTVDVIVCPTAPSVAWKIGEKSGDPMKLYLEDVFTIPASLAGLPGLTVPAGYAPAPDEPSLELPVGLQILGPVLGEAECLMVGHVFEQAMKEIINSKKPKIF